MNHNTQEIILHHEAIIKKMNKKAHGMMELHKSEITKMNHYTQEITFKNDILNLD